MMNLAFLLLAAASPAYTIPATIRLTHDIRVQVGVNDAGPFWCTFDTGGGVNISVDREIAEAAGLHPTTVGHSSGAGAAVVEDARLPGVTLKLGDLSIPDRTVVMRWKQPDGCVFGTAILANFVVQMDYLAGSIRLFSPSSFVPPAGGVSVPLALENDHPVVPAKIVLQGDDAIECRLTVDTALGPLPLVLAKGFTDEKQILTRVRKVIQPQFGASGVGGAVTLLATRIDRLSIGDTGIDRPIAVLFRTAAGYQEKDGLIGGDFLHRFLVTIDYPGRRMFLEPNRSFNDPPFAYDGSGMNIQSNDGGFFVASVLPEGPAALAGFEKGDMVLAVDGKPAAQLTRDSIRERLLYRSSGTRVTIKVRRGDQELTHTIELKPLL
jgi:hypothetical protein